MILFLHHRYRVPGGEERAVADLATLVRERLDEDAELLERSSLGLPGRRAAAGLIAGGLSPDEVGAAVRRTGARIVHAHNLLPTLGWRSLRAARQAGARVVLHLHQYRLVCAIGVCFRDGAECVECHGRDTRPGLLHDCRGSLPESAVYAASLALWQRRLLAEADVVVVPSAFAGARLRELGAPIPHPFVVPNVVWAAGADDVEPPAERRGALVASRLAPEKGVDVAIDACARAGVALTIAGEGPERAGLERRALAGGGEVAFIGRVGESRLTELRGRAEVAVVASRSAETFGLAAAGAMAVGLPVAASRIGALPELVPDRWLAPPGDAVALADVIERVRGERGAGAVARAVVAERAAPDVVAEALSRAYAAAVTPAGEAVGAG